jgi:adenylate kinase
VGLKHISTGEIFRQEIARNTLLGRRVQRYVTQGRLVPDALVVKVMVSRLTPAILAKGFVLDGFPRTRGQAVGLDRALAKRKAALDAAIYIDSPERLLVRRLTGRRVCSRCGANYHLRTMRPKRSGWCDHCGGRLIIRKDDEAKTIKKRLAIDRNAAKPLLAYYRRRGLLVPVNGIGHIETVCARLMRLFHKRGWWTPSRAAHLARRANDRAQNRRRN